jgi:hypothetical protein
MDRCAIEEPWERHMGEGKMVKCWLSIQEAAHG